MNGPSFGPHQGHNESMDNPRQEPPTDLELKVLDLLHEKAYSAELLAETLSREGEQLGMDAVRSCLEGLASRDLVRFFTDSSHHTETSGDEPVVEEVARWEITEEGRTVVEPHLGVARAPHDREIGDYQNDDERDVAGLVVLLLIALVTAVCAAYTLLTVTGVLGGG
jgi:hypothetical protein